MASGGSVLEKKEKRQFMDDYIPLRVVAFTSRILPSYVVRDPHFHASTHVLASSWPICFSRNIL